jgi:hypothetical protein
MGGFLNKDSCKTGAVFVRFLMTGGKTNSLAVFKFFVPWLAFLQLCLNQNL